MKRFSTFVAVVALVALPATQVMASYITLDLPGNVAPLANARYDYGTPAPGYPANNAIDGKISDGAPGQPSFEDDYHAMFIDTPPAEGYILGLDWSTAQNLTELGAYVATGNGSAVEADKKVSTVDFYVCYSAENASTFAASTWTWVGIATTPTSVDVVGGFDLMSVSGDWSNVYGVAYKLTPMVSGARIAEATVVGSAVPEPASMTLLWAVGLVSMLAYAWRKRR